jgi:hypothetical protein
LDMSISPSRRATTTPSSISKVTSASGLTATSSGGA